MERVQVNPIVSGFAPDPSLICVDGIYFLVNSTFHLFPGLPIYASADLKKWKHIGNAFNRTSQLDIQQSYTKLWAPPGMNEQFPCEGGLYAPTIRHHKGTFYIICTNVQHPRENPITKNVYQNFILSTNDIWANDWSDPVFFDFHGIDTSLFWDDDDRVYVVGSASPADPSPMATIHQFEIDLKTGRKLSEEKLLWEGITKVFPEGPHTYKKDGWYYLLIAEGGCFAGHHSIMARSRDIWGPYEVNPANPVLKKADANGYFQYTSHGDLFQGPSGQWYFCCLGVRKTKEGRFIMGRETFLTTAQWPEGEYPVIDPVGLDVPLPDQNSLSLPEFPVPANSPSFTPELDLIHIRRPADGHYQYENGSITLTASKEGLNQPYEPVTFVGKRQRLLTGTASATLTAGTIGSDSANGSSLQAGLCYYKDELRFSQIFLDMGSREIVWQIFNKAKSMDHRSRRSAEEFLAAGPSAKMVFGISYTEADIEFWYVTKINGKESDKTVLGKIDTLDLTAHEFVGPVVGIFATGEEGTHLLFNDFHVQ
ncbi:glycosyl hydrolase [Aspergillus varians]